MFSITGMFAIPRDPHVEVSAVSTGSYINFKAVTQAKNKGDKAVWHHWDVALWVPDDKVEYWKDQLVSGNVFIVEHASVTTYPVQDGKYHNTKIRLEHNKVKRLTTPMWAESKG